MKFSTSTLLFLAVAMATVMAENLPADGETCYNYDHLIPLDPTKPCTRRTVFLSIRDRWMASRKKEARPKKCPGWTLNIEIMAITNTSTVDLAHKTFENLCQENMELYNSVPPPVCYNYNDVFNLGEKKCTGRTLFLNIRKLFREQSRAKGAEKCFGGLDSELKALTQTTDIDDAHEKLQSMCDDEALDVASMEAAYNDWKCKERHVRQRIVNCNDLLD